MATPVIMPKQGQSVESCVIGKWHKQQGDEVNIGDVLFTYETDKATFDFEATEAGTLLALFFEEGDDVECLKNVCVIGEPGEDVDGFRPDEGDGGELGVRSEELGVDNSQFTAAPAETLQNSQLTDDTPHSTLHTPHFSAVSPRARRLAERTGADIRLAVPTGANGRIVEADIQRVLDMGRIGAEERSGIAVIGNNQDYEEVKLSNVRKLISKTMHASLIEMAQLTHHTSFDASDLLCYRKKLKAVEGSAKITVTDIIVYALSRVLPKHKSMNAHFMGESIRLFKDTHIGVAVDTPRGLLVPTLFNANKQSLEEISGSAKGIFEKCLQGSIEPDLLQGATFTVSNLGTMGIEMFTPIINPPQTGILGVCCITERTRDGGKFYPAMGLSLTYDHRALDGAEASRFLKDLVDYLESFSVNIQSTL